METPKRPGRPWWFSRRFDYVIAMALFAGLLIAQYLGILPHVFP